MWGGSLVGAAAFGLMVEDLLFPPGDLRWGIVSAVAFAIAWLAWFKDRQKKERKQVALDEEVIALGKDACWMYDKLSQHGGGRGVKSAEVAARWHNLYGSTHQLWHKEKNRKIRDAFLVACNGAFDGRHVGVSTLYDTMDEAQAAIDEIKATFRKLMKIMPSESDK